MFVIAFKISPLQNTNSFMHSLRARYPNCTLGKSSTFHGAIGEKKHLGGNRKEMEFHEPPMHVGLLHKFPYIFYNKSPFFATLLFFPHFTPLSSPLFPLALCRHSLIKQIHSVTKLRRFRIALLRLHTFTLLRRLAACVATC